MKLAKGELSILCQLYFFRDLKCAFFIYFC